MTKKLIYLALDVDDNSFTAAGIYQETGELIQFKCKPTIKHLTEKLKSQNLIPENLKICYESTYLGFSLARDLLAHGYQCEVIASSLIPEKVSKKIKTDRIDAEKLALYYMKGLLTTVSIPNKQDEALRQLIRLRKNIKKQITAMKNKLKAESRLFNIELPVGIKWNETYYEKLKKCINTIEIAPLKELFITYLEYIDIQVHHLEKIEKTICVYAVDDKYKQQHDALVCLRGFKTLTAMTLIAEIGDINRFSHPQKLVSYVGLDIAEYSSGGKEKKGGITKTGNNKLRSILVESQQILRKSTMVGRAVRQRRLEAPEQIIRIVKKCDARIYKKTQKLLIKNKHVNKIKVACAREMVGFVWEIMREAKNFDVKHM